MSTFIFSFLHCCVGNPLPVGLGWAAARTTSDWRIASTRSQTFGRIGEDSWAETEMVRIDSRPFISTHLIAFNRNMITYARNSPNPNPLLKNHISQIVMNPPLSYWNPICASRIPSHKIKIDSTVRVIWVESSFEWKDLEFKFKVYSLKTLLNSNHTDSWIDLNFNSV